MDANSTPSGHDKPDLGANRFIRNSMANVITGAASALVSLLLPSVLARHLSKDDFSAWALILQLAAYTSLLSLGMQVAVGRFVAIAREMNDLAYASRIVSTAFFVLAICAVVALGVIGGMSIGLDTIFPSIPPGTLGQARQSLLFVGGALAVGLPFMALNGVFVGYQRNAIIAAVTGGSRALLALVLVGLALSGFSMVAMGAAFAAIYCISYGAQWVAFRRLGRSVSIALSHVTLAELRELGGYCLSITVWSVSMIMVSGLDIAIVGRVDFKSVAGYAACVGLVTFISSVQSALFSPLLQVGAALYARKASDQLGDLLLRTTRLCALSLLLVTAPLLLFAHALLTIWLGHSYSASLAPILMILVIGNVLRLIATPFALLLLATGQHRRTYLSPVLEGVTNVTVCILAGIRFGVNGVAFGMLSGAIVGQLMNLFFNLPRTTDIDISIKKLCQRSLAPPFLSFLPIAFACGITTVWGDPYSVFRLAGLLGFLWASWCYSLDDADRAKILGIFEKAFRSKFRTVT